MWHADGRFIFLDFDIDEELPGIQAISRTRQLYPTSLLKHCSTRYLLYVSIAEWSPAITGGVDSATIKANASMESVVLKVPATSIDNHLKKASEESWETTKKSDKTVSPVLVTPPEHQLKRVEKHHQSWRDNWVGAVGASHEKAQLLSNKTQ